jgi:cytochrome c553
MKNRLVMTALLAAAPLAAAPLAAQSQTPAPTGRDLAAACAICHGTNGVSAGITATLAGQPREALVRSMSELRDGKRPATIMHQIGKGYSDAQIDALAAFFAAQKAR